MQIPNTIQLKKIRPYSLAASPFIGLFAYLLNVPLSHRPLVPDVAHDLTIRLDIESKVVFVSTWDLVLLFGALLCAGSILITGFWRVGAFQGLFRRQR